MNAPLFSVIIPVYKVEAYLEQCIDSVLAQGFVDYEIILVNDGSPDTCGQMCEDYADRHNHITAIHKENGGLSDARNVGIRLAKGKYLIFLDSDDFWSENNVLSSLTSLVVDSEPDIILHGHTKIDNHNHKYPAPQPFDCSYGDFVKDLPALVKQGVFDTVGWNKIVNTRLVREHQLTFPIGKLHEDCDWCFSLIKHAHSYAVTTMPFYQYRVDRAGAITTKMKPQNILDMIDIVNHRSIDSVDAGRKKAACLYLASIFFGVFVRYYSLAQKDKKTIKKRISSFHTQNHKKFISYMNRGSFGSIKYLLCLVLGTNRAACVMLFLRNSYLRVRGRL